MGDFREDAVAATKLPVISPLRDGYEREVHYLRLSLTERCNFRCTYCMPEEGLPLRPARELLDFDELERLVGVFASLGVRRVRLTGGEPTVRKGVVGLVERLAAMPGVERLVMTSNGALFPELAEPLARAGLWGVNISLDTVDPATFRATTRRGDLDQVIRGIDAALASGLEVKLNAVALRGLSEEDGIATLCRFAWERGIVPRFIEHMPMSDGSLYTSDAHFGAAEIRAEVERAFGTALEPVAPAEGSAGPARYAQLADGSRRRVGVISALTENFCETCNRVRVSSTGELHTCLAYDDATDLRTILRGGGDDDALRRAIRGALDQKRAGHQFCSSGGGAPRKHMIAIGG